MSFVTQTISLETPVVVGHRTLAAITLREPTSRLFMDLGPGDVTHVSTSGRFQVEMTLDRPGCLTRYLRVSIVGLEPDEVDILLDQVGLRDALVIRRAFLRFLGGWTVENVEACTGALAFDHRQMSITEADGLGLGDLAYTITRLNAHIERRAAKPTR